MSDMFTKNIALLADSSTASSAEIFIAGIQSVMPEVKLVGARTYGKARGQILLLGPDSALAKVTCMRFTPVTGDPYDMVGIQPDIPVPEGGDAIDIALSLFSGGAFKRRMNSGRRFRTDVNLHSRGIPVLLEDKTFRGGERNVAGNIPSGTRN